MDEDAEGSGPVHEPHSRARRVQRVGRPLRLVLVRWRDAWFDVDQPDRWRSTYPVQTIGFLVREEPQVVTVAQERLPYGDGFRALTHIPTGVIESMTTLFAEEGPARREGDRALAQQERAP